MLSFITISFILLVHKFTGGWLPDAEHHFKVAMLMDFFIIMAAIVTICNIYGN